MPRAAIQLVNQVRNPSFETGNANSGLASNWLTPFTLSYPSTGGFSGTRFSRATATADIANINTRGWYLAQQLTVTPGTKLTCSYYVRPSVDIYAGINLEQNNGAGTIGMPNPGTLCPANVWTRVSYTFTTTGTANLVRPAFYMKANALVANDYIDTDAYMVTFTDYLTDYKDASSDGWSWQGTAFSSESAGPYFVEKPLKARSVIYNYNPRPQLSGTGAIAIGGAPYSSGTTITGTRSVSDNKQTITATSLVGGFRRFGILVDGRQVALGRKLAVGDRLYMSADVDTTNLAPGTRAQIYTELRNEANQSYAYPTLSVDPGGTKIDGFVTVSQVTPAIVTFYMWVVATSDFTGSTTAVFSNFMVTYLPAGVSHPGYFDGDTPGCSWVGAANNSPSTMPVWQDATMRRWNGTSWVTA